MKMLRLVAYAFVLIVLSRVSLAAAADVDLSLSGLRTDGAIPNAETAKRIAVALLIPYMAKNYVASLNDTKIQAEWNASLSTHQEWVVAQKRPEGSLATGYVIILNKQNGSLVSAYFQQ